MERDARTPTSPVCTTPLCEPHPHVLPCSSSSSDDVGRKSCSRRTGHQRGDRERVQGQSRLSSGHVLPEPSEINTPAGPRETGSSTTSFADHTESQNPSFESTVDMGHKRKMPSPVTVSNLESMSRSLHKQTLSQSEIKRESPESPPPVKRWVIGPFFQSFRSKMASFTDIVMSPTRLFKPSDNPSLTVHPDPRRSDAEPTNGVLPQAGGGVQDMGGKGKEDPRTHLSITKKQPNTGTPNHREIAGKVKFDTNSNDHSGLEQERPRCGGQSPAKTPPLNQSVQFHSVLEENVEVNSCSSNQMLRKKGPLSSQLLNSESATCESSQPNKPGVFGSRQDWPLHRKQTSKCSTASASLCLTGHTEEEHIRSQVDSQNPIRTRLRKLPSKSLDTSASYTKLMKGADMTCKLLGQNPSDDCIEDVAKNTKHKVDPKRQRSAPPSHGEAELTPQDLCSSADPSREKVHRKRLANCGTGTRDRRKRQKEALSTETRQETTEQRNIALKNVGTRGVKPKEVIGEDTTKDISALISGTLEENPASAPTFKKRRAICTSPRTQGLETTHTASNTSGPVDLLETSSEGQRRRGGGQRRQQSVHRTPLMFCTGDNLSQEKQHDGSSDNNNSIPTERAAGTLSPCLAEQTPADNQFRMSVSAKSHRARQHQTSEQVRELHAVQMNVTVLQTGSISGEPHDETAFKGHSNQVGNGNTASELKCSTKTQQHDRADRAAHSMTGQDSLETLPPGNTVEGLKEEQRMSLPVRPNTAEEQRASRGQGGSRSPLWMNTDPVRGSVRPREKRKADASKEEDNYTNRVFKAMPRLEEQSCVREDSIRREMLNEDSEEQVSRVEHKDGKDKMRSRRGTKKGDRQRRRCRSHFGSGSKVEETRGQTEEETQVVLSDSRSERLTRSFSCPEITSLLDPENTSDTSPMPVPALHDRTPPSLPKVSSLISTTPHSHVKSKRARRHTVCSLEVEREIAPLCLRKEVYPASRTVVYGKPPFCPSYLHSPSTSLTALASCFLSSPLAFLSRRSDQRSNRASAAGDHCCGVFSSSLSGLVNTTSVSTSHAPFSSSPTTCHPKNVSTSSVSLMPDQCSSSLSLLSDLSQSPVEESRRTQQHDCKDKAEESRLTLHPRALTDEKALSDSEIKTDTKQRGKVSSIRIRKTLPKPQNNLTPMGLPKAIRVKKKVFSLEEIYTNKNFTQPPEGRLETIFEVPVDRRDGSQSLIGPKRIKRFVVFPELGVARKPKRPLIGGTAGVGGQRKVGVNLAGGRTRQGAWVTSRDEVPLMSVDLDSLLCSKLAILDSLVASDK